MWPINSIYYTWLLAPPLILIAFLFFYYFNRKNSLSKLLSATFVALAIPTLLVVVSVISTVFDIRLDTQSIYDSHDNPRNFFIALDNAERPYELIFFSALIIQVSVINLLYHKFYELKAYNIATWLCGIYFTVLLGINLMNIWVGSWPRS